MDYQRILFLFFFSYPLFRFLPTFPPTLPTQQIGGGAGALLLKVTSLFVIYIGCPMCEDIPLL